MGWLGKVRKIASLIISGDDGFILTDEAVRYEDLRFPVTSARLPSANPPEEYLYVDGSVLGFEPQAVEGNEERVYFIVQLPHAYNEGSIIYPHIHWTPETDDAAAVRWKMTYSWANVGELFLASTPLAKTHDIDTDANKHLITSFDPIIGTGKEISSVLICQLRRNSSHIEDTFDDLALLITADFHVVIDGFGSQGEFVK